jgi:hypothetical protein
MSSTRKLSFELMLVLDYMWAAAHTCTNALRLRGGYSLFAAFVTYSFKNLFLLSDGSERGPFMLMPSRYRAVSGKIGLFNLISVAVILIFYPTFY